MARRAPLTRPQIAQEALALIDAEGLDALTMRALGRRLGVEAMTLYHHFPSKGALLDAVTGLLFSEVEVPAAGDLVERMAGALRSYRAVAVRHPSAFVLMTTRRAATEESFAAVERILSLCHEAGLDPATTALVFRLGGYFAGGAGHAEIASRGQIPDATPIVMDAFPAPERFPRLAEAAPFLAVSQLDALFEWGLGVVLAAFRAEVERAAAR